MIVSCLENSTLLVCKRQLDLCVNHYFQQFLISNNLLVSVRWSVVTKQIFSRLLLPRNPADLHFDKKFISQCRNHSSIVGNPWLIVHASIYSPLINWRVLVLPTMFFYGFSPSSCNILKYTTLHLICS
jgi:hypothetical protein